MQQLFYLKYRVKTCFNARILLFVNEIFVHKKRSDKICCSSKPVNRHLFGYQSDRQLGQFHIYRSDEKIWGMIFFFQVSLTKTRAKISPATGQMPEWKPGLSAKITENVIDT